MPTQDNQENLRRFGEHVTRLRRAAPRLYDRYVNMDLARQQSQDLLLRHAVAVVRQTYADARGELDTLAFDREGVEVSNGLSRLTARALEPFGGFADELLQYAVHKHRTSCALSNFPEEHKPSADYVAEVVQAVAAEWREFALQVNEYMLNG